MIRQIFRKEVLGNLLSLRFILSLLLTLLLLTVSSLVFVKRYERQSQDYWKKTNENLTRLSEQSDKLYQLAFYKQEIYKAPKPLTCCVEGFEKSLPDCIRFDAFTSDLPQVRGQGNFILPHFSDIDWVFIISLILSFVALVFTYDSICGEKETGTLSLMLAGTVPRYAVLLGKYFAAMLTLGIPLCIGLLANLFIVVSSKEIFVGPGEWIRIFTIVLLSFLCLSAFVLLGMFVSSRTAHAANSMVILLLLWVGLVILMPSLGRIVSDLSAGHTTQVELHRKLDEASKQISENADTFGDNASNMATDLKSPVNNPPAHARYMTAQMNAKNQVLDEHYRAMLAQVSTGRNLAYLSPVVSYHRASEVIAGTGINHCTNLRRQIKRYQDELKQYIRDEDAKDPDSLHLVFPEEQCARSWKTISHRPVDFANIPKFRERDLALGASLKLAIWDIGLLALFNLVLFAATFVSFLRYDVR